MKNQKNTKFSFSVLGKHYNAMSKDIANVWAKEQKEEEVSSALVDNLKLSAKKYLCYVQSGIESKSIFQDPNGILDGKQMETNGSSNSISAKVIAEISAEISADQTIISKLVEKGESGIARLTSGILIAYKAATGLLYLIKDTIVFTFKSIADFFISVYYRIKNFFSSNSFVGPMQPASALA